MKLFQLSQEEMNQLVPGQRTIQDKLLGIEGGEETEAIAASGAIDPDVPVSLLTVVGTKAYTLAGGTFAGQEKVLKCVAASDTPLGTVTIANPSAITGLALSATHIFTAAGQELHLMWNGSVWVPMKTVRAGTQVLVIGTTLTAGMTLAKLYDAQVTATVSSETTKALPNGQFPGDRCVVGCSVAASSPVGLLGFVGVTVGSAAVTQLTLIGATTDTVTLEWTGTAWLVIANSGITLA